MTSPLEPTYIDLTVGAPAADPDWEDRSSTAPSVLVGRGRDVTGGGFEWLFDGSGIGHWRVAGCGEFVVVDDRLESVPGDDLGLFWCTVPAPADFQLRLEWLRWRHEDSSGVFVRFPRPSAGPYGNPAFTAIQRGFEVQIDEVGLPGARAIHRTGAIFDQHEQRLRAPIVRPPAEWNEIEITVRGQCYAVQMNGAPTTEFENRDPARGLPSMPGAPSFIGLQVYPGSRVAFRRIAIRAL